jgi:tRNA nucleotidyltransferase (CCA-adding enzyme)
MNQLQAAQNIMKELNEQGHEVLIVGGYVRDHLMGKVGSDIDLATSAKPEEVQGIFKRTILTGLKHGTVTVVEGKYQFEITTYRTESSYQDKRHPDEVKYVLQFEEDVRRRDFTMNALGMTLDGHIIDHVGGIQDINDCMIRTVGQAEQRFNEDALRMLRAFRFMSQLGFQLDDDVIQAIKEEGNLIQHISIERILVELEKMIAYDALKAFQLMIETGFLHYLGFFSKGIELMVKKSYVPNNFKEFLTICTLETSIESLDGLPIANYIKKDIHIASEMVSIGIVDFNSILLFRNGLELCLMVNRLNHHLNGLPLKQEKIQSDYESLPIKKLCDLKFKGDHIIDLYQDKKPGAWIGDILDDVCLQVLLGELENEIVNIRQYVLKNH